MEHGYSFGARMHQRTRARAEQLAVFLTVHGRLPARAAEDDQERDLAAWAYAYRRSGAADAAVLQIIADGGGYHSGARASVGERRREELVTFINTHGRLPRNRSADQQEQALFFWTRRQIQRPDADPVVVQLVQLMGGIRRDQTLRTFERVAQLEQFVATHGRLPRSHATDAEEASLGGWLGAHRNRRGAHARVLEIIADYESHHPGAGDSVDRRLEELRAFVRSTGRTPKLTRTRPEESSLARWVATALTRPQLAPVVEQILAPYGGRPGPSPRNRSSPTTQQRTRQLRAFLTTHGRPPRHDGTREEQSLYRWLHRPSRVNNPEPEILELLPALGQPDAHARRVTQLEQFLTTHNRLPRSTGTEHELYTWLNQHLQRRAADPAVLALVTATRHRTTPAPEEKRLDL